MNKERSVCLPLFLVIKNSIAVSYDGQMSFSALLFQGTVSAVGHLVDRDRNKGYGNALFRTVSALQPSFVAARCRIANGLRRKVGAGFMDKHGGLVGKKV